MRSIIEDHAIVYLNYLEAPKPPAELFGQPKGRAHRTETWTEDLTKACLYLYLSLLPVNQELIHE